MANRTGVSRQWTWGDARIAPEPDSQSNMVEIRPKRTIRIKHLNPKPRDEKFEKEMHAYLQYRESAVLGTYMPPSTLRHRQKSNVRLKPTSAKTDNSSQPPHSIHDRDGITSAGTDGGFNKEISVAMDTGSGSAEVNSRIKHPHGTPTKLQSPALSLQSQSVQSVSGVHVDVTRPSSLIRPLGGISEKKEPGNDLSSKLSVAFEGDSKNSKSPRKTKGHRPVSGKSVKTGARSIASSDVSDTRKQSTDFTTSFQTHLNSMFKDVTLFFIHGVGGSADIWNAQIDFFANLGLEVIAPDLIGHGFSQSPDNQRMYHFNEILADLETLFDKYCKRQNIVIGHSYG